MQHRNERATDKLPGGVSSGSQSHEELGGENVFTIFDTSSFYSNRIKFDEKEVGLASDQPNDQMLRVPPVQDHSWTVVPRLLQNTKMLKNFGKSLVLWFFKLSCWSYNTALVRV